MLWRGRYVCRVRAARMAARAPDKCLVQNVGFMTLIRLPPFFRWLQSQLKASQSQLDDQKRKLTEAPFFFLLIKFSLLWGFILSATASTVSLTFLLIILCFID